MYANLRHVDLIGNNINIRHNQVIQMFVADQNRKLYISLVTM